MSTLCASCRNLTVRTAWAPVLSISMPTVRAFSTSPINPVANRDQINKKKEKQKKKKKHINYQMPNLNDLKQYSLVDAMQYIRAFEVGQPLAAHKYELAVRLKTKKDGPVLRNSIRLPHAVKTDIRVCVICPKDSKQGRAAKAAGAVLVGEEEVLEEIKNGKVDFDRCLTTPESLPKIQKAGVARILGPRGLMPSIKLNTVTDNVAASVVNMLGASTYRERTGVVRLAIAQLASTPEQLRDNVSALIAQLRKEGALMSEQQGFPKEVYEVVSLTRKCALL